MQVGRCALDAGMRNDEHDRHFIQHRMLLRHDSGLAHAGHHRNHLFDLGRCDILAADLEHVLGAVAEPHEAVLQQGDAVAGDEIAVLVKTFARGLFVVQIFRKQRQAGNALDQEIAGAADIRRRAVILDDSDLILRRGASDRHRRVGLVDLADDPVRDGFRHAPPADRLHPEGGKGRRLGYRGAPEPELVMLGNLVLQQRLHAEGDRRGPGAVVFQRHAPEPAGGKPRLDHASRTDP